MDKEYLIRTILAEADKKGNTSLGSAIVEPLRRFGQAWWAGGNWHFSEQRAEIALYSANTVSRNVFGEGGFEVKQPTPEQVQEAIDAWNSGEIFGYRKPNEEEGKQ